jgi:acetyl-CoA acyltransferase
LRELNEAFAVQVVYCRDELGLSMDKLNVDGGSISVGHPYGMTGSRLTGHIVRELQNRDKQFGVVTKKGISLAGQLLPYLHQHT